MADRDAWRGLWNPRTPGRRSGEIALRLVIYLGTPLALALLFGEIRELAQFARAYLGAFIVGVAIGAMFELLYWLVWPAIVRHRIGWPARLAGHAVTLIVAVGLGGVIADRIARIAVGWQGVLQRLWLQGAVIAVVTLAIAIVVDEMGARARELELREAEQRIATLRARLSALQARTDPHFLFNSLNTVAALIPAKPALAEALLEHLAGVFRYALEAGRRELVPLADELAAVTAYFEIEALRLGARLSWRCELLPEADAVRIPPLTLQPLVENAIRHGAEIRLGVTEVVVAVRRSGSALVLSVFDRAVEPAGPQPSAPRPGTGTALGELRARLVLAYAGAGRLEAGPSEDGWRAEVTIPL